MCLHPLMRVVSVFRVTTRLRRDDIGRKRDYVLGSLSNATPHGWIAGVFSTLPVESLHKKQEYQPAADRCASVGMTYNSRSLSTIVATCRPKSVK